MKEKFICLHRCSWCGCMISEFGLEGAIYKDKGIRIMCDSCYNSMEADRA